MCEYAATSAHNLKLHKKSMHEGLRYPCDVCEFASTRISDLKRHKLKKHDIGL